MFNFMTSFSKKKTIIYEIFTNYTMSNKNNTEENIKIK